MNILASTSAIGLGFPPLKLVLGLPACSPTTVNNSAGLIGCGYGWLNYADVQWLITKLQDQYPNQFGGVMAWVAEGDNGSWNSEVWYALKADQAIWGSASFPGNGQPGVSCLDNPSGILVQVDSCANFSLTQFWQFSANYIINVVTGNCLALNSGAVQASECSPNSTAQQWKFYGNVNGGATIFNANVLGFPGAPIPCLDGGQSTLFLQCNGGTYQSWYSSNN
jgi:hypothetical protein